MMFSVHNPLLGHHHQRDLRRLRHLDHLLRLGSYRHLGLPRGLSELHLRLQQRHPLPPRLLRPPTPHRKPTVGLKTGKARNAL